MKADVPVKPPLTLSNRIFRWLRPLSSRLPARWLAFADYYFRPSLKNKWGGPFNGQKFRRVIFRELRGALRFEAVIETGTYLGYTTEFLLQETVGAVYSVETTPRFFHYARRRFASNARLHLALDESPRFLERLAADASVPKRNVFFYLDAHWYEHLPLREELSLIGSHWNHWVAMIDDFQVMGDPGYRYDDYGPQGGLTLRYLDPLPEQHHWSIYFPAAPSGEETGRRRGCVVIADREAEAVVAGMTSLRRWDPTRV